MTVYFVVGLLIVIGIFFYIRYAQKYTKRFAHVGLCAAQTYIMFNDKSALCATRTVAATMSKVDKAQLLTFLARIPINADGVDEESASQRRAQLLMHISSDKSGLTESVVFKNELEHLSKDWLQAVAKCDAEIADKLYKEAISKNVINNLT